MVHTVYAGALTAILSRHPSFVEDTVDAAKEVAEKVVNVIVSTMKAIANGCTTGI